MLEERLLQVLQLIMQLLRDELRAKYKAQGHNLTGKLINSIDYEVFEQLGTITGEMCMEDYGEILNRGVSAAKIPYTVGGGRRGGTSKYIQGLIGFFQKRGLGAKEAKGAAFATAAKHKKEGMPTRNSFKYSKDGTRLGAIDTVLDDNLNEITRILEEEGAKALQLEFDLMIDRINQQIAA